MNHLAMTLPKNIKTTVSQKYAGSLEIGKLPIYMPSVEIKSVYNAQFKLSESLTANEKKILNTINKFKGPLTPSNFFDMLNIMIQIEDYGAQLGVIRSTKLNRHLVKVRGNEYTLKLHPNEGRPLFLLAGDMIWVNNPENKNKNKMYGVVKHLSSNEIQMKFKTTPEIVQQQPLYSIHFEMNRLSFKLQRFALYSRFALYYIRMISICMTHNFRLDIYNKKIKGDTHQLQAVHHIVTGTAYPLPYILIGFPGTGKTATIVESVYQLWKMSPKNKILVCAQSNSVCDEIAQRLMISIPTKGDQRYNIIRLFAASVRKSCNNEYLLENSNFNEQSIPCLMELYKYRIIVSTLTVSGRLLQADMLSNHFTHLFIDECESATESSTLIPITLCSSEKKINAHVVLCGDPNQLGPVVRESMAREMTMDISMFKRLSSHPVYQKNKNLKSYDPRIISILRNNYRCHPHLGRMPNELFYNNEMKCSTSIDKIQWLSELDFLPKCGFPILFEHVNGISDTKENCSSWFNDMEMESVLYYIDKLLNNEPHKIMHRCY